MKIRIIAVGRQKASPAKELCAEYLKRMKWDVSLREVNTPKGATSAQEAPLILQELEKQPSLVVALDERGETLCALCAESARGERAGGAGRADGRRPPTGVAVRCGPSGTPT